MRPTAPLFQFFSCSSDKFDKYRNKHTYVQGIIFVNSQPTVNY